MKIHTVMPALAVSAALTLAGCTSGDPAPSTSATSATSAPATSSEAAAFNDADVSFAQQMYPHHAQATQMAQMVTGRTENTDVLDLAGRIERGQGPEMDQMASLLDSFGQPAPTTGTEGMDDPEMSGMDGMMSATDMTSLQQASGATFDEMWLTMMIEHHTGAIEMARAELDQGVNSEARQLATAIEDAQQDEITTMRGLLDQG